MEINSQPDRVDLSDVNARLAKMRGLSFVIDTDAHSTASLEFMRYGVFMARRAGLTREDVLNTRAFGAFETWRKKQRSRPVAAAKSEAKKPASRKKIAATSEKVSAPKRAARSKGGSAARSRSRPKK
jgi:DNA polymerase (family 10)